MGILDLRKKGFRLVTLVLAQRGVWSVFWLIMTTFKKILKDTFLMFLYWIEWNKPTSSILGVRSLPGPGVGLLSLRTSLPGSS